MFPTGARFSELQETSAGIPLLEPATIISFSMSNQNRKVGFTRRELLRLTAGGATLLGSTLSDSQFLYAFTDSKGTRSIAKLPNESTNLYSQTLKTWCDGLMALQIKAINNPALYGGLLCPACSLVHGRCGDAAYPLLKMARVTGDSKYIEAAVLVHDWSEHQVSRPDGSWVNDVTLSSWKGITVFHAIALAEALQHHGALLDESIRRRWTDRLARAVNFLDGFMTIQTGNINYPITGAYCFAISSQVLGESRYLERARQLAHKALEYFTPGGLLFGEGHPLEFISAKKCRPVDLGYNVEESLPALALYALLAHDEPVLAQVKAALKTHMEFMLPDGSWDNSWGTRNYKWTWWGSRTSDGCLPAYVLLAEDQPKFLEAARRNLELMAACTHNGLLYGGPHYFDHGDLPCVHHTFTHAKALATVLDRGSIDLEPAQRTSLPRDEPYGIKTYPEIGTRLAAIGDWRATVTEYDWEYTEHVQAGGSSGGGHVSGGALSVLFDRMLGPILVASMTAYQTIEISNQQVHRDYPHMELTPRIESVIDGNTYISVADFSATVTATTTPEQIIFNAQGRLLTARHEPLIHSYYKVAYILSRTKVGIVATANAGSAPLGLMLPVVSQHNEIIEYVDAQRIRIRKHNGSLLVRTYAPQGFDSQKSERTFNLVPGFECLPLMIKMRPDREVRVELSREEA